VYACTPNPQDAKALIEQAAALPELSRPLVLQTSLAELPTVLQQQASQVRFDFILGRNALMREPDKAGIVQQLVPWLQPGGNLVLAESIPRYAQRLYRLLDSTWLSKKLYQALVAAEETIYRQTTDPMVNWDAEDLQAILAAAGFRVELQQEHTITNMLITPTWLERWFSQSGSAQPSYAEHLAEQLASKEIAQIRKQFERLINQTVPWQGAIAYLQACLHS
jgi:putative ATPase